MKRLKILLLSCVLCLGLLPISAQAAKKKEKEKLFVHYLRETHERAFTNEKSFYTYYNNLSYIIYNYDIYSATLKPINGNDVFIVIIENKNTNRVIQSKVEQDLFYFIRQNNPEKDVYFKPYESNYNHELKDYYPNLKYSGKIKILPLFPIEEYRNKGIL